MIISQKEHFSSFTNMKPCFLSPLGTPYNLFILSRYCVDDDTRSQSLLWAIFGLTDNLFSCKFVKYTPRHHPPDNAIHMYNPSMVKQQPGFGTTKRWSALQSFNDSSVIDLVFECPMFAPDNWDDSWFLKMYCKFMSICGGFVMLVKRL